MSAGGSAEDVLELCRRIAVFSDVAGEITRTFLSPATREVQSLLRREWEALGMTVRVDSAGNLRGLLPGAGEDAPVLLMGSHLDTVPNAGAYDGLLGIAVATAVVGRLGGRRLPFAIELIAFSEEEGIRFGLPFIGSRALVGDLGAAELARRDADGVTVAEAIRGFGLDPEGLGDARMTVNTFALLEVHMEQGPVLESLGVPLGVVTAIVGQSRYELTLTGQANHAGTTPMHLRRDALGGAAEFVTAVENYARGAEGLVATVGSLRVAPGAVNVVPGAVVLSLDVRHGSDELRVAAVAKLLGLAERIAGVRGLALGVRATSEQASVAMDAGLRRGLMEAMPGAYELASGAGHDAMIVARAVGAAMLFLRTPGGLSHHPEEAVLVGDVAEALDGLERFLTGLEVV